MKAIDQNILASGGGGILGGVICLIGIVLSIMKSDYELATVFASGLLVSAFIFMKIGMEKTVFVYRATNEHLEICQWQDIPDLVFTFLRLFPFIIVGIILMSVISNPDLSVAALVGPALVGVLIASVGADSSYKAIYKKFRQHDFRWCDVDRAMLDINKGLLALSVSSADDVIQDEEINFNNPKDHRYLMCIYFRKDQEEAVISLFKNKMPSKATTVNGQYTYLFAG